MSSRRSIWRQGILLTLIFVLAAALVALLSWHPSAKERIGGLVTGAIENVRSFGQEAQKNGPTNHALNSNHGSEHDREHKDEPEHDDEDHIATAGGGSDDDHKSDISPEKLQRLGVEFAVAEDGPIAVELDRPAEVKFDSDHVVHVVPRVPGVVSQVEVSQGQVIKKGALLAVLNSRELAELKAAYLADLERHNLSSDNFERERRLWEKKISSEKDYLVAKSALAEANIALTTSEQKLRALGFSPQYVETLRLSKDTDLTRYEMRAPIAGTVIERHLSLGEAVSDENNVFVIAKTSSVWVDITVYSDDLPLVKAGQTVRINVGDDDLVEGEIAFVTANVHEETRTAVARVIVDNAGGHLKPGMFVKVQIEVGEEMAGIRLPKDAIQNFNNSLVVFVQEGEHFEPRNVKLGIESAKYVQVLSGIKEGETYVSGGAFTLKALIQKSQIGEGHVH